MRRVQPRFRLFRRGSSLLIDGVARAYQIYAPAARQNPAPLVVALHGGGGRGAGMRRLMGFDAVADSHGFIVVYPDGLEKHWNDRRGSGREMRTNADDVHFISVLMDHLSQIYSIDPSRVYVAGISNGGMMTYRLACDLPGRFAAAAAVCANMTDDLIKDCKPSVPIPMMIMNGTDDPIMPYAGGSVSIGRLQLGRVASTADSVTFWVNANQCIRNSGEIALENRALQDGTQVYLTEYTGSAVVALYRIEGGGHTWAGGPQYLPVRMVGRVSQQIQASEVIWSFFTRFKR